MKKSPKVKVTPKKITIFIIVIGLIVAVVSGLFFFMNYQKKQAILKNPQFAKESETKDVVEKVGKLIKLPSETPSIATVSDITKLKDQTLFQNAQNGDKVLIFNQAKRAIVYRPSENVIIEIGNVVVAPQSTPSADSQANEKVKAVLLNATTTAGYAKKIGADLVGEYPNLEISSTSNANGDYKENTVYVITSNKISTDLAKEIASSINGEVKSALPTDESKPTNADILVILGK